LGPAGPSEKKCVEVAQTLEKVSDGERRERRGHASVYSQGGGGEVTMPRGWDCMKRQISENKTLGTNKKGWIQNGKKIRF